MKIVGYTLLLFLFCGCAATMPPGGLPPVAPLTTDKATVYVIQGSAGIMSENLPVLVDGRKIGALSLRSYTWFQCVPGTYKVAIADSMMAHRMLASTQVTLKAGEIVYLKYVLNQRPNEMALVGGFLGDLVSGRQVSVPDPLLRIKKEEAENLLSRYELVGNTHDQK